MPDGTTQIATSILDAGKWVVVFLLGLVGFNLKRTIAKVEEHDRDHVSRSELLQCSNNVGSKIDKIETMMIAHHNRITERIDRLVDKHD